MSGPAFKLKSPAGGFRGLSAARGSPYSALTKGKWFRRITVTTLTSGLRCCQPGSVDCMYSLWGTGGREGRVVCVLCSAVMSSCLLTSHAPHAQRAAHAVTVLKGQLPQQLLPVSGHICVIVVLVSDTDYAKCYYPRK